MKSLALLSALLAATAIATPTPTIEKRATTWCSAFGSLQTGGYTVYHNNWGAAQATSGSQCTTFNGLNGNSALWETSWTWQGGPYSVKSYSNVALENINKQVWEIKSIPSTWTWSYTGSNVVANVAYDLWLSPTVGASAQYEIMVWLGALGGAGPISETGSPIATPTILGVNWRLYKGPGPNNAFTVFSFVADRSISQFSGDLKEFFNYVATFQGVSWNAVVTSLQAGTEPFTGSNAVFKTSGYTISYTT